MLSNVQWKWTVNFEIFRVIAWLKNVKSWVVRWSTVFLMHLDSPGCAALSIFRHQLQCWSIRSFSDWWWIRDRSTRAYEVRNIRHPSAGNILSANSSGCWVTELDMGQCLRRLGFASPTPVTVASMLSTGPFLYGGMVDRAGTRSDKFPLSGDRRSPSLETVLHGDSLT